MTSEKLTGVSCLYCHAALSRAETTDGWCGSCGKRLPPLVLRAALVAEALTQSQANQQHQRALAGWILTGAVLGFAGLIASRLLFDLPHVHEPESSIAPWLFGAPALGGLLAGIWCRVVCPVHRRLTRAGGCLLTFMQVLIALGLIVLWL